MASEVETGTNNLDLSCSEILFCLIWLEFTSCKLKSVKLSPTDKFIFKVLNVTSPTVSIDGVSVKCELVREEGWGGNSFSGAYKMS